MGTADDRAVVLGWWREFAAAGAMPSDWSLVHTRLIRSVHRAVLPSGPVHVKTMDFPRWRDRLRYLLRALPAAHEARLLRRVAAAGLPCPEVVAALGCRLALLPRRSMLVLRSLQTAGSDEPADQRLADEARLAARLLAAGIHHRDLHSANFLRLADGRLAVLDLQSARVLMLPPGRRRRIAVAARLLRDRAPAPPERLAAALLASGLLRASGECERAQQCASREAARYHRRRLRRCLTESTEFTRRFRWLGTEHRRRGGDDHGMWWWGRGLIRAWLGDRLLEVETGRQPVFAGFFRKWWWLGGGSALYVPRAWSRERIEAEVQTASEAYERRHARAGTNRMGH